MSEAPPHRAVPLRAALVVGGIAAGIRLVWVMAMSRVPTGLTDLTLYPFFAESIAQGDGYRSIGGDPTAYYPPGYPYFLGTVQWLLDRVGLGEHLVFGAGLLQALLGGVAAGAVVVAGSAIGGRRLGLVAGAVMALWPNLIVHSSLMLSETLFIALFTLLLAALLNSSHRDGSPAMAALVGAGVAMGACTLVRPQSTFLTIPAVALAWLVSRMGWRDLAVRLGVLVGLTVLVVAPWTIRNAVVMDAFVPVSTNSGDNLCMGFNDDATGGFMAAPDCETGEFYVQGRRQELRRDAEARERALDWATSHLGELPALSVRKLAITYADDRDGLRALESFGEDEFLGEGWRRGLGIVADAWFFTVLGLSAAGVVLLAPPAWRARRRDPNGVVLLAVTLAAVAVPVVSFADTRFKVPVAPCMALLAAVALTALWSRRPGRGAGAVPDDARDAGEARGDGAGVLDAVRSDQGVAR